MAVADERLTAETLDRIEDAIATCGYGAVSGRVDDLIAQARRCLDAEAEAGEANVWVRWVCLDILGIEDADDIAGEDEGLCKSKLGRQLTWLSAAWRGDRRKLADAAAREAALVEQGNYLREIVDAVTPEDEDAVVGDGPLDGYIASDCLAAIGGWDAVLCRLAASNKEMSRGT